MQQLAQLETTIAGGTIPPVSIFYAKTYPLIFFSYLKNKLSASFIDFDNSDFDKFKSNLSISFLGSSSVFLVNISSLSSSKRNKVVDYLVNYTGPNSVLAYTDNADEFTQYVDLDKEKKKDSKSIFKFLGIFGKNNLRPILDKISQEELSVDELLILYFYSTCLGSQRDSFESQWLGRIIKSSTSLFDLSGYFFSKNRKKFFRLLAKLEESYSEMFWISFWSEQIYRAYFYIDSRKKNDLAEAKRISYKLPFSFMQKDWKFIDCKLLSKVHNDIYKLDYSLKNGSSNITLDLFYSRYFSPI